MRRFINWFHWLFDRNKAEIEFLNNEIQNAAYYIDELLDEIDGLRAQLERIPVTATAKSLTKKKRSAKVKSGGKKK